MKLSDEMLNMARRVEEMELTIARLIDAMAGKNDFGALFALGGLDMMIHDFNARTDDDLAMVEAMLLKMGWVENSPACDDHREQRNGKIGHARVLFWDRRRKSEQAGNAP